MSADQDLAQDAEPVPDHPVATLVMRARNGDELAWDALVERYAPLIWSLCRRYRLSGADAADVGQNVWLQLVNQLGKIRDPAASRAGSPPQPGGNETSTHRGKLIIPTPALASGSLAVSMIATPRTRLRPARQPPCPPSLRRIHVDHGARRNPGNQRTTVRPSTPGGMQ